MNTSIARLLALRIGAAVTWLMPARQQEWRQAMRSDLHYIDSDGSALRWACGCLLVALHERVKSMVALNRPERRGALLAEMFLCLFPLTLAWCACIADLFRGWPASMPLTAGAVLGAAGPVGLIAATRFILSNRRVPNWLTLALIVSSLSLVVLSIGAFASEHTLLQVLRDTVLIGFLPAIAFARMRLSRL